MGGSKSPSGSRSAASKLLGKRIVFDSGKHQTAGDMFANAPPNQVLACRAAKADTENPEATMGDDPIVIKLEEECARLNGKAWRPKYGLMQLVNPSKTVNLERELIELRAELNETTDTEARLILEEQISVKE